MNYIFIILLTFAFIIWFTTSKSILENFNDNCLSGEFDNTKSQVCMELGCPIGMTRGYGIGKNFCYNTCVQGYIDNGNSSCYNIKNPNKIYDRGIGIPYSLSQNNHPYFMPLISCLI